MSLSEFAEGERIEDPKQHNTQNMLLLSAMPWYVYIGQAPTRRYYTGISTNPRERIQAHNSETGAKFSRDQGALRLIYVSPPFATKSEARLREMQIKGWTRTKKEKLICGEWK